MAVPGHHKKDRYRYSAATSSSGAFTPVAYNFAFSAAAGNHIYRLCGYSTAGGTVQTPKIVVQTATAGNTGGSSLGTTPIKAPKASGQALDGR